MIWFLGAVHHLDDKVIQCAYDIGVSVFDGAVLIALTDEHEVTIVVPPAHGISVYWYGEATTEGRDVKVFYYAVNIFKSETVPSTGANVKYRYSSFVGVFLPYGEDISAECGIDFLKVFILEVFTGQTIAECLTGYAKHGGQF